MAKSVGKLLSVKGASAVLLQANLPLAFGMFLVLSVLSGCGAGNGNGLDRNGQPISRASVAIPLGPTLASIQANIFTPTCAVAGCHRGASPPQGLLLDSAVNSAASLIGIVSPQDRTLIRVRSGMPDISFVIQKLEGKPDVAAILRGEQLVGDQMPQSGPYLPQATIDVVRLWITEGAKP